jgi:LPXTG-site transpeptidase (sortase) family protein
MTLQTDQADDRSNLRRNRLSLAIMGLGVGLLVTGAVVFFLVLGGVLGGGNGYDGPGETLDTFGPLNEVFNLQPTPTAPPTAILASDSPIERILIPKFDVDAPMITLGLDENNVMESPDDPCDVAWYDFTSYPGFGSNAVFSGHVDWYNLGSQGCRCDSPGGCGGAGPAVFWNLKDMVRGDLIEVRLQDGTVYQYRVIAKQQVSGTSDFREIVSSTEKEIVTLITCGGTFNQEDRHYNDRVVIQAERVLDTSGDAAPSAAASP